MVVAMARFAHLALQLLFLGAFLVNIANAIVINYTPTVWDNAFCNQENKEVLNGCIGPPGTCRRPYMRSLKFGFDCRFYVECEIIEQPANYTGPKTAKANIIPCPGTPDTAEYSWITRTCGPWGAPGTCSWKKQFSYEQWSKMCQYPQGCDSNGIAIRNNILGQPVKTTEVVKNWATETFCKHNPEVAAGCKMKGGCTYRHPGKCNAYIQCVMDLHLGKNATTASALLQLCPPRDRLKRVLQWSDVTKKCEPKGSPGTCGGRADIPTIPARKLLFTPFCGAMLEWQRGPPGFGIPVAINGDCVAYFECLPGGLGVGQVKHCSPGQMFNDCSRQCEPASANGTCRQRLPAKKLAERAEVVKFSDVTVGEVYNSPFCFPNSEQNCDPKTGCKGPGIFAAGFIDDCQGYWECFSSLNSLIEVRRCSPGRMFNAFTLRCETANANGTCYQRQLLNNITGKADSLAITKPGVAELISPSSLLRTGSVSEEATCGNDSKPFRFPLRGDCFSYVETPRKGSGQDRVKRCPQGQMFNPNTRECGPTNANGTCVQYNHEKRTTHYERASNSRPVAAKNFDPPKWLDLGKRASILAPVSAEDEKNVLAQLEPGSYCTIRDYERTGCKKPQDCVYPYLSDCYSYIKCTPGADGNITAHWKWCPHGQEYSLSKRMCRRAGLGGTCSGKNYTQHLQDEEYCSINPTQEAGCQEPTNCTYQIGTNKGACDTYIQCKKKLYGDGRTGTAYFKWCDTSEEFSNQTLKCEPAGAPGICSEKKTNHLAMLTNTSVPANTTSAPNRDISDSFDCCSFRENGTCVSMKSGKNRNPKDCNSYIECVADPASGPGSKEGLPLVKYCPQGKGEQKALEWNDFEEECSWAGAPGTCSGKTNSTDYGFTCPKLPFTFQDVFNGNGAS
ncbi:hypothetical protein N431DRAFT_82430 [Stipitochalara longipes BDJ]|nr:hypothetical protein N431DRAFT_82430 [Stipitochalara longipes BDJ]